MNTGNTIIAERNTILFSPKIIDFAQEPCNSKLLAEMLPLWASHYSEIAFYKDIPLQPTLDVYETTSKNGSLRIFTVRHDKKLVGYEVFFVYLHPHYSVLEAVQDILFLEKDIRQGSIGYRFIKWCDQQLEDDKVEVIFRCVSNKNDYSPLLKRLGYIAHDTVYSRRVICQQQPQ